MDFQLQMDSVTTESKKNVYPDKGVCFSRVDNHLDFAQNSA